MVDIKNKIFGKRAVCLVLSIVLSLMFCMTAFAEIGGDSTLADTIPQGTLVITKAVNNSDERLSGAFFEIRNDYTNALVAIVSTDINGEASINLDVGKYYIHQVVAPTNYLLNTVVVEVDIFASVVSEVTYWGYLIPIIEPTPTPTANGRLLVTSKANDTGELLSGTTFEIVKTIDGSFVAQITTNQFGEASTVLPVGEYYLREYVPPVGFLANPTRINVRIIENNVTEVNTVSTRITNPITPSPTPQPTIEQGRLLVTSKANDTGELLSGTIFEVVRAIDGAFVAQITTNQFGEASTLLPVGEYFLRELVPPVGFLANPARVTLRITANRVTDINTISTRITANATPSPTQPPTIENGRLLIINRGQGGVLLSGAIFEIRGMMNDVLIRQVTTNQYGEAAIDLPAGDYYYRQIIPSNGYVLDNARTTVRIKEKELLTVTVVSSAVEITEDDDEEEALPTFGRLLVTVISDNTRERLANATVTVHDNMTDELIETFTTNAFGEISVTMPTGRYFLRQSTLPQGFIPNYDRIPFTVKADDITEIALVVKAEPTPTPSPAPTRQPSTPSTGASASTPPPVISETSSTGSKIEIITRAAGSGNPLSGGVFAVFSVADNRRIAEITTAAGGKAVVDVTPGTYYIRELRPTYGFFLEDFQIYLDVGVNETVTMELTKERDFSIADLPHDIDGGFIFIPQTGQYMSVVHYVGGAVMLLVSLVAVGILVLPRIRVFARV